MSQRIIDAITLAQKLGAIPHTGTQRDLAFDVVRLMRLSASLRGLAERECSDSSADFTGPEGPKPGGREYSRRRRLVQAVSDSLAPYGLAGAWDLNNDPRGCAVYIHFPDGSYNTMGGRETGWGI